MIQPVWIERREVSAIHERLLVLHGGASGLRDEGLLESALARPLQHLAYATPDLIDLAAAYTTGIVRNHPFVDGNKRTGFVVGILFLEMNGYVFTATDAEAAQAVLELAAGTVEETGFTLFLRDHVKRVRIQRVRAKPKRRA